jgi:hypothetical protein
MKNNHPSSKLITAFSARSSNPLKGYERARLTKKYLRFCFSRFSNRFTSEKESTKILAAASGYSERKLTKFRQHKEDWLNFDRPIPISFAEAIGVKRKILEHCIQKDQLEFDEFNTRVAYPQSFGIRYMSAIYGKQLLPEGTDEEEAIEIMKQFVLKNKLGCWLNIDGIRSTYVFLGERKSVATEADLVIKRTLFKPMITFSRHQMRLTQDNLDIGNTYIA